MYFHGCSITPGGWLQSRAQPTTTPHTEPPPPSSKNLTPHLLPQTRNPSSAHLRACGFFPDLSELACLSEERMKGCGARAGTVRVSHSEFLSLGLICYSVLPLLRKGTEPPLTSDPSSLSPPSNRKSKFHSFVRLSPPLLSAISLGSEALSSGSGVACEVTGWTLACERGIYHTTSTSLLRKRANDMENYTALDLISRCHDPFSSLRTSPLPLHQPLHQPTNRLPTLHSTS